MFKNLYIIFSILLLLSLTSRSYCEDQKETAELRPVAKYGYADETGKFIIKPQFDYAGEFCDGIAVIGIGSKYGYIDKTGKMIAEAKFDEAMEFCEGYGVVRTGEKYGYIDKTGKIICEPKFDFAYSFSEGYAGVQS
ncbi:MAG: WG repeat-containing protein, partial [Candidatus Eremiobacterota bacterium]